MYRHIRSSEAEGTRSQSMKDLKGTKTDMGDKIYAASAYSKAFEFQLWNDSLTYEDAASREVLYLDAANEFTKRVDGIYRDINKKMKVTEEGKSHNKEMAFYALAATMHSNHRFQEEQLKKNKKFKTVSFYDLVRKSLLDDFNGNHMLDYETVLTTGVNKDTMVELLKARGRAECPGRERSDR